MIATTLGTVANMLAAAYWRGKIEGLKCDKRATEEAMIKASAECDLDRWLPAAKVALGGTQ